MAKDSKPAAPQPKADDPYKQFTAALPPNINVDVEDGISAIDINQSNATLTTALPPPTASDTLSVRPDGGGETMTTAIHGNRFRDDADPTMVKAYELLERIQVGGLLSQWAGTVYVDIGNLLPEMRKAVLG